MTTNLDLNNLELTDDTETQNEVFMLAFNSGDGDVFDQLYREDAISNLSGEPLNGAARRQFVKKFLAQKPKLKSTVKHSYRAGDIALVIVDYDLEMTGEDGAPVQVHGTCTDVMRRGTDGKWIMVIDRPVADALPQ